MTQPPYFCRMIHCPKKQNYGFQVATILPILLLFLFAGCKQGLDPDLNARLLDLRLHLESGNEMLDINDSEIVTRLHFVDEKIQALSVKSETASSPELSLKLTELNGMKKIMESYFLYQPQLKLSLNSQLNESKNWETSLKKLDRSTQFSEVTKLETIIYQLSDSINKFISPVKETELGYHHLEKYFKEKEKPKLGQ